MRAFIRHAAVAGPLGVLVVAGFTAIGLRAQESTLRPAAPDPSLNFYGVTGLIDMPSAQAQPDATLNFATSSFAGITRSALSFQITPRLSATFRYTALRNWGYGSSGTYYDRSFDLRYQILSEGRYRPAVTVGLQDFVGTDLYGAEYLVATKTVARGLTLTFGLGWGRLGSYGAFGSPLGPRPAATVGVGGTPSVRQWFRGPAAPFGGIEWRPTARLGFKVEYSSDAYTAETGTHHLFRRRSPWNLGVEYEVAQGIRLGVYEMYGDRVGLNLQLALHPDRRPTGSILGPGPVPVHVRPDPARVPAAWKTDWVARPDEKALLRDRTAKLLAADGLALDAITVDAHRVELRFRDLRYQSRAQALGRAARDLSVTMPASVETFVLVPVEKGMALAAVTMRRSDLEHLEFAPDAAARLRARVHLGNAGALAADALRGKDMGPRLRWSIEPYLRTALFDPQNPLRADLGVRLSAAYDLAPGVILSGSVTKKIIGNLNTSNRTSNSVLPHVRSDANMYDKYGDPAIERLTAAWYGHPAGDIYTRVTAGYLERMFGGISAEALWQPANSRLALGAELDYVRQRDFNDRFGFRNYSVATGYLSAYYQFRNGFFGEIDAGRYLAGDYGATLTLSREFANGWQVGAFATLTNVSFQRFGEGSFDKGIFLRVPLNWVFNRPERGAFNATIRPVLRDGGAKLDVAGRLYDVVRAYHAGTLDGQWGRVLR